jgi:hypothetical protein
MPDSAKIAAIRKGSQLLDHWRSKSDNSPITMVCLPSIVTGTRKRKIPTAEGSRNLSNEVPLVLFKISSLTLCHV